MASASFGAGVRGASSLRPASAGSGLGLAAGGVEGGDVAGGDPLVLGVVILYATLILLLNLVADVIQALMNPRIRLT